VRAVEEAGRARAEGGDRLAKGVSPVGNGLMYSKDKGNVSWAAGGGTGEGKEKARKKWGLRLTTDWQMKGNCRWGSPTGGRATQRGIGVRQGKKADQEKFTLREREGVLANHVLSQHRRARSS